MKNLNFYKTLSQKLWVFFICLFISCSVYASNKETQCLTLAIYKESRGESEKGKAGVAQVIHNRVKSSKYPNSFCKVISQKGQFSWFTNYKDSRKLLEGSVSDLKPLDYLAYQESKQIALKASYGLLEYNPKLENSLYFVKKGLKPEWTKKLRKKDTIEGHDFY